MGHGGLSSEQEAALTSILCTHGVPQDAVNDRVKAAVKKVGAGPIALALQASNPWQALKAAAAKPGSNFKYVSSEELQAYIEHKAQQRHGTSVPHPKAKKQKGARSHMQVPLQVDAGHLQLSPGSFVAADSTPLKQLAFHEVQSQASGVCFVSPQQAAPFLSDGRSLSVEALALLVTAEIPVTAHPLARVTTVRFPALYAPTGEAVLVLGSLIQLGDEEVLLAQSDAIDVEGIETIVCRVNLYRDEAQIPWDQVVEAPLRALMQNVPGMKVCKDAACNQSCAGFHPAVEEEVDRLLLDVWARMFTKSSGGKTKPAEAAVFQAYVRVPASAPNHLFKIVCPGLYVEPRAEDGSGTHPGWAVVWLPGAGLAQAQHAHQTCSKSLGLARLGCRYGLRVRDSDEQAVFTAVRPQHAFSKVRVLFRYRLHPLPFGFQRAGVVQLLKSWSWNAKPLQPDRGDSAGSAWVVGASEEPAAQALPHGKNFVLVTKLADHARKPCAVSVCASQKTRQHILLDDDSAPTPAVDPWSFGQDPWSKARASADVPMRSGVGPSNGALTKLTQIEDGLRQDLESMARTQLEAAAPPPGLTEHDKRLHALEVNMTELKHQNQKFEGWFQSFGSKVSEQAHAMSGLQATVKDQQAALGQLRSEVQSTVTQAVSGVQKELTHQLALQMEQIQALFADKKQRT